MEANKLIIFGGLLLAGIVGSTLASRTRWIPGITGMMAVGVVLGPSGSGVLSDALLAQSRVFIDIALGLILFDLGLLLDLRELARSRTAWLGSVLEALLTFLAVYTGLVVFGVSSLSAALAAAVAISSSPAVLLLVTRQLSADGPVTRLSLQLVALNNIAAFIAYSAVLPVLHADQQADRWTMFVQPLTQLFGSIALAVVLAFALVRLSRRLLSVRDDPFPLVVGFILLSLGLAQVLGLSPLLTLLTLGVSVRALDSREHLAQVQFGRGGDLFFLILFVLAGANLHLDALAAMAAASGAFVLARFAAQGAALYVVARRSSLTRAQSLAPAFTLLPMAGLAIGLVQSTQALYPGFGDQLSAIVLGAVAILETIGPIATEVALKRVGEVPEDASVEH